MFLRKCLHASCIQRGVQHAACTSAVSQRMIQKRPYHSKYERFPINEPLQRRLLSSIRQVFSSSIEEYGRRHYSVQNLFRLTETSASQLQPYLDIENVIRNVDILQESINKRQLSRRQVKEIRDLYEKAQEYKTRKEVALKFRQENSSQVQLLLKREKAEGGGGTGEEDSRLAQEIREMRERGRQLREEVREAENKFNQINDELVDFILSLPNTLSRDTPEEAQLLKESSPGKVKWVEPEYTAIETNCGPGLLAEFPVGESAYLDIDLRGRAQAHLLEGGFVETGNAEYVRRIILHGAGIDHTQFLRIREPNVKKGLEHTTYLAGGASFPSFLALFAQSVIENQSVLPLRYFVIGRSYQSQKSKPGIYQSHVVQAFVACRSEEEMEREVEHLQALMESFYSDKVGFAFQTQIVPASRLHMYEKKRLAFVMKGTDKSPSKMIGCLSTVGDYVSKRLLCCYLDGKKNAQFLHLVSAKFFDITHFLRTPTPKLITHADLLARVKAKPEVFTFGDSVKERTEGQPEK